MFVKSSEWYYEKVDKLNWDEVFAYGVSGNIIFFIVLKFVTCHKNI
jgi:hypothetical protein